MQRMRRSSGKEYSSMSRLQTTSATRRPIWASFSQSVKWAIFHLSHTRLQKIWTLNLAKAVKILGFLTIFIHLFIYLFYYFWLHWVFIAARGLSLVAASGGYSSLRCTGFSLQWLLLFWSTGSRHMGFSSCGSWALRHRLSSCGAWA